MPRCALTLLVLLMTGLLGTTAPVPKPRPGKGDPVVVIRTSKGTIKVELFEKEAPITVRNFLRYVDDRHYDGTIFHRVISNFMIQGGGYEKGLNTARNLNDVKAKEKRTRDPIKNESNNGLSNRRGTLSMARTVQPDSATAQFFINVKDNIFLDGTKAPGKVGYCVFGKVIEGMDVVDKITAVKTRTLIPNGFRDVPQEEVIVESMRQQR